MSREDIIGIVAAFFTSAAMLPQLIKVLKTKKTEHLSGATIGVMTVGVAIWVYYGLLKMEIPIILSNSVSVIINLTLLVCIPIFRKR